MMDSVRPLMTPDERSLIRWWSQDWEPMLCILWSAFCQQWIVVAWCMLIGRD